MQKKKALSLALAAAAILGSTGLVGCGKKDTGPVYSRRTNVYKTIELSGPDKAQWIDQAFCTGDAMVMVYTQYIEANGGAIDANEPAPYADDTAVAETTAEEAAAETTAETDAETPAEAVDTETTATEEPSMEPDYATTTKTWLYSVQLDGSGSSEVELNLGLDEKNGGYINEIFAGPNGSIYLAYQNWVSTDTDSYTQVTLYSVDLATGQHPGRSDRPDRRHRIRGLQ